MDIDIKKQLLQKFHENFIISRYIPGNHYKLAHDVKTIGYFFEEEISTLESLNLFKMKYGLNTESFNRLKDCLSSNVCQNIEQIIKMDDTYSIIDQGKKHEEKITALAQECSKKFTFSLFASLDFSKVDECYKELNKITYDLPQQKITDIIISSINKNGRVYILVLKAETTGLINRQYNHEIALFNEVGIVETQRGITYEELLKIEEILESKSYLAVRSLYYDELEKFEKQIDPTYEETIIKDSTKIKFIQILKDLLSNYNRKAPAYPEKVLRNIYSTANIYMDSFKIDEMKKVIAKYNFSKEVSSQIETAALISQPNIRQKIDKSSKIDNHTLEETIGFVEKKNDRIFFAIVQTTNTGDFPFYLDRREIEKCSKVLFFKDCQTYVEVVPEEVLTKRLEEVHDYLLYISTCTIRKKLDTIYNSQTLLGQNGSLISISNMYKAIMSKKGQIIVGAYSNPVIDTIQVIGRNQDENNGPYSLQVKENGRLYIINGDDDKVWTSDFYVKGEAPYSIILDDRGTLILLDVTGEIIYRSKN